MVGASSMPHADAQDSTMSLASWFFLLTDKQTDLGSAVLNCAIVLSVVDV